MHRPKRGTDEGMHELNNRLIKEYVGLFEQKYGEHHSETDYNNSLEKMKEIDLENITEGEIITIIRPFLYEWGKMGRVRGRSNFTGWERKLKERIQSNYKELQDFRTRKLADADLSTCKSEINERYKSSKEAVGRIGAAKVLHLICPTFFPLWDNGILEAVRNELTESERNEFSEAEYYMFMLKTQKLIHNYKKILSDLAGQHGKGELKILDECLWWATHRGLSLFLR